MEQVTRAQARPVRRRRRWLIVALLLVLVSMVSWWYANLPDARFVGLWAQSVWVSNGVPLKLRLDWNGRGSAIASDGTSLPVEWTFDGDIFAVNMHPLPQWQQVLNRFKKRGDYYVKAYANAWTRFTVQRINENQVVVLMEGANPHFPSVFTRIPE